MASAMNKTMIKRYFIADLETDLENGWSIETDKDFGSNDFWEACDLEVGFRVEKAVEVDSNCEWLGDNLWR